MSKLKYLSVAAINVRVHPNHNPEIYRRLIKAVFALKRPIQVHGERHLLLLSAYASGTKFSEHGGVRGQIGRFTQINLQDHWLNVETMKEAEKEEVEEVKIPDSLRPNFVPFSYYFDLKSHRFIFEYDGTDGGSLSPNYVLRLLERLFADKEIKKEFGDVDLTVEPSVETVRQIFKMPKLTSLEVVIKRPNPDDHADEEADFLKRMRKQNAKRAEQKWVASSGDSLVPDEETKAWARIGEHNGVVKAVGVNSNGKRVRISTEEHPAILSDNYDPKKELADSCFLRLTEQMINSIKGNQ